LYRGSLLATAAKGVHSSIRKKWQHWVSAATAVGFTAVDHLVAQPLGVHGAGTLSDPSAVCEREYSALRHCAMRARRLSAMAMRSRIAYANSGGGLSSTQHPAKITMETHPEKSGWQPRATAAGGGFHCKDTLLDSARNHV